MTANNLAEIVETLCGSISASGDHSVDEKRIGNCYMLHRVVEILMDDIQYAVADSQSGRYQNSVDKIYELHRNELVEIRNRINEWLEDYEE